MADPVAVTISVLALIFSLASFAWQYLRKIDSVICTLVANEVNDKQGAFQFSIANLGNRPALIRDIQVQVLCRPELYGNILGKSSCPNGTVPQVIKAGEIILIQVETKLSMDDLIVAAKQAEKRGGQSGIAELFYMVKVTVWNPEGKRFVGTKHISTFVINYKDKTSGGGQTFNDRAFQVSKEFGLLGSEWLQKFINKIRDDMRS
jgi:hypothetical protein